MGCCDGWVPTAYAAAHGTGPDGRPGVAAAIRDAAGGSDAAPISAATTVPATGTAAATVPAAHGAASTAAAVPDAAVTGTVSKMSGQRSGRWSGHHLQSSECCDFPDLFCCPKSESDTLRSNHFNPLQILYAKPLNLSN